MTSKRTFQGSVRQLIRQMEQKNDKMTIERKMIASLKSEDKQSSSYAIHSVDDNESSNFFKKSTIPKQTANTVGSLNMASEFSAGFSAEEATSEGNEEEGYGKDAEIDNGIPVATDRVSIDKIASGNSREVALKAANAEEFKFTISIDDLNEGHWRTFDSTYSEGQNLISKARRPDLLPLRPDSYNRPAFSVTPDEVHGNAANTTPDHVVNPFQLPVRFWKRVQTSSGGSDVGPSMSVVDDDVCLEETEEEEETRRGENMEMALAWIQQELRQMKEDDRRLARQLLQLRASVHQLRGLTDCQSFNSDEGDADVDPDWSSNSSRSTRSLDLCPATSSSIDGGGGGGGCFASTPAAMDTERHRRIRSGLLGDDDGVQAEVVGSDPQLFTGRRCPRKEVYV